ncbi:hypothetical protein MRX96_013313 [Rhipicephalus microplus]
MATVAAALIEPSSGFCFENCRRNAFLQAQGLPMPKATKTGTTIAGIVFKDGVILGADTRATAGGFVADKNCNKIHYLAPNIFCCGAGTAADTDKTTRMISSQLELHRLATGRVVPVCAANRMLKQMLFRYQGHISAALVLGGRSLAAMAVFERDWKPDMALEDGKKLVRDAIAAGIFNDLGSGGNVDIVVITREGVTRARPYEEANKKGQRHLSYKYKKGTSAVLSTKVVPIEVEETIVKHHRDAEAMDTA